MPTTLTCPACMKRFSVRADLARGVRIRCPICGQHLAVRDSANRPTSTRGAPATPPVAVRGARRPVFAFHSAVILIAFLVAGVVLTVTLLVLKPGQGRDQKPLQ